MAFSLTPQPRESVYNPVLGPGQKFSLTPNPMPSSAPNPPYVRPYDPAAGRPAFGAPAYPFGQGFFQQTAPPRSGFSLTPAFAPINPGNPFRAPNHPSSHHSRRNSRRNSNHHSSHHSRHSNHHSSHQSRRNSRHNSRHNTRHNPKPIDVCPSRGIEPTQCNVKKDYLRQSLIFHPDKNKGCEAEATIKFQTLQKICALVKGGKLRRRRKSRRN
jgi:hypothetical protein